MRDFLQKLLPEVAKIKPDASVRQFQCAADPNMTRPWPGPSRTICAAKRTCLAHPLSLQNAFCARSSEKKSFLRDFSQKLQVEDVKTTLLNPFMRDLLQICNVKLPK